MAWGMAVHICKLCVGADRIEDLQAWQDQLVAFRLAEGGAPEPWHDTRMAPKRAEEVLAGGSIYWVIRKRILVRQRIIGLETHHDETGRALCRIRLDPRLVRTQPRARRPFQGWRYLEPEAAPPDLDGSGPALSADLEAALKEAMAW
jgi:hypothetical protein